ncbi:alpha/beta fold hydrolase [Baekduia alba]|uniref:alpha/beta fold hydrolase n=1 Tax=Baekduia alba TaxID=2997333 RepID=UPI002341A102|nr:alpha/beta fold hydrolase [Baekduia alba]
MTPPSSPFVLVPGAGGEGWYWSRVAPLLRAAGHDAIAVDLPAGDEDAGLDAYADVILEAVGGRTGVTLVAQSMGAFSAPLAAERADVAGLLLVCPMIPAPGESASGWWAGSGQLAARRANEEREGRDPDAPFDEREAFFHDVAPEIVEEAYAGDPPQQADKPFEEPFPLSAWPDIPTRVLLGRHDRLFPYAFMRQLSRDRLGVEADAVDAGHLACLAQPEATAQWLLRSAA